MTPEHFVVTILGLLIPFAVGIVFAGRLTPIPWKFPNYEKQLVVNKIAAYTVVVSCLALGVWRLLEFLL